MKRIKIKRIPRIQYKYLKKLAGVLHYDMGYMTRFFYNEYTYKNRYINLHFAEKDQATIFETLKKILHKNLKDRLIPEDNMYHDPNIHITEKEFVKLYNTLVAKNEKDKVTNVKDIHYKYMDSDGMNVYNVDPTTLHHPICRELKQLLKDTTKRLQLQDILVALDEKTKEASVYFIHLRHCEKWITKYIDRLKSHKILKDNKLTYFIDKTRLITQIDLPANEIYTLFAYLKLTGLDDYDI